MKYCSNRCRRLASAQTYKAERLKASEFSSVKLNSGTLGAIHELLVCSDLLRRGASVFRSITPDALCDLLILIGPKLYRVEVTTGYVRLNGQINHPPKDKNRFDVLAVVEHDGTIHYFPSVDIFIPQNQEPKPQPLMLKPGDHYKTVSENAQVLTN